MAAEIKGTLKRKVRVFNIPVSVIISMTEHGLEMSLPGFKTKLSTTWETIAQHCSTPVNVPSFLAGKPLEFLKYQAKKLQEKGVK